MKKTTAPAESKRVRALCSELIKLIKVIPRSPNNRATLTALQQKHFTDLLAVYVTWRIRHVAVRSRAVSIDESDARWAALADDIALFHEQVWRGADLAPYLSRRAVKEGFVLPAGGSAEAWDDKDFLLNIVGLHHFHLKAIDSASGANRTNEVLFARVSRGHFRAVGIFDHSVFEFVQQDLMTKSVRRCGTFTMD